MISVNICRFLVPALWLTFMHIPFASTFSHPSSIPSSSETYHKKGSPTSNRIFIAGLSEDCTRDLLQQTFITYGEMSDISIIGFDDASIKTTRKPYAFVTFDSQQSARAAISDAADGSIVQSINNLFQQVHSADPVDSLKRQRSNKSRKQQETHRAEMIDICSRTNLILQVQSTHVDRLVDYLQSIRRTSHDLNFEIEGSEGAVTRNMSLMFLSVCNPTEMALRLGEDQILSRALKKAYVVHSGAKEARLNDDTGCETVAEILLEKVQDYYGENPESEGEDRSFKMHAFPPSNQARLLSAIERVEAAALSSSIAPMKMDPRLFTDIVSIVQVYKYKGSEVKDDALVMAGLSPSFISNNHNSKAVLRDGAVNRAYFKLKEAFDRYQRDHAGINIQTFENSVALDCGSAPGGWTKYLAEDLKCKLVHSVDPGNLDVDLDNVNHMQMKIQDAIPILKEQKCKINVFVSDACLHEMIGQLEFLLLAKESNILDENTFFVLTLKCTTGYSKASFDGQATKVVNILKERTQTGGVSTYHLFSNKNGERTIMGFLSKDV